MKLRGALRDIFGDVYSDEIDRIAYSSDASQIEGNAACVIMPTCADDIEKAVEIANRQGFNIVARGAGTGLCGGAVPQDSIVLDMSRMDSIEIDMENRLAHVGPGAVLDAINAKAGDDLFFPVQPGSHSVCTIGGMISTDAAGHRAIRYGRTSSWIEELEVVDGKGMRHKVHGDAIMDFCGTEGTVGIVVGATLRLAERPSCTSVSVFNFEDLDKLMERAGELKKNSNLTALEFIDKETARLMGLDLCYHLIAEFDNAYHGEIKDAKKIEAVWKMRDGAYPALASKGYSSIEDPKVSFDRLPDLINWLQKKRIPCFGHLGIGIIHPCFWYDAKSVKDAMYAIVLEMAGSVSGEHGIGLAKKEYADKEQKKRIAALKRRHDPRGVLNRGKII